VVESKDKNKKPIKERSQGRQKGLRVKWNFTFKKIKTITTNIFIVTSRLSFILLIRHDRLFRVFDTCLSLGGICIKNIH
jgi:hypothetical protein